MKNNTGIAELIAEMKQVTEKVENVEFHNGASNNPYC